MYDEKLIWSFDSGKPQPLNANYISPYEKCPYSKNMQWKKNQIYSQVNRMFQEEFFVIEIVYILYLFMINVIFIFSLN